MDEKRTDQNPQRDASEWFNRFFELDGKPVAERTTSENFELAWILEEILWRIEMATQISRNH